MAPGKSPSSLWGVLKKLVKKGKLVPKGAPLAGGEDTATGEDGEEPAGLSYKVGDTSYRLPG